MANIMNSSLSAALAMLPKLKRSELAQLRAAIDDLAKPATPTQGPLYGLIARAIGHSMPFGVFAGMKGFRHFQRNEEVFLYFVKVTWPDLTETQTHGIIGNLLEMILSDLRRGKIPVNITTVVNHLVNIPYIFDEQFPGYRLSHVASLVKQAMVKR